MEETIPAVEVLEDEEEPLAGITVSQSVEMYAAILHSEYVATYLLRNEFAAAPDPLKALDNFDSGFLRYVAAIRPDPPETPDHGAERLYEAALHRHGAKMEALRTMLISTHGPTTRR